MNRRVHHPMKRHIMLFFLSRVRVSKETHAPTTTRYREIGDTQMTNESALRYLLRGGWSGGRGVHVALDRLFFFVSKDVRRPCGISRSFFHPGLPPEKVAELSHLEAFEERLKMIPEAAQLADCFVGSHLASEGIVSFDEDETIAESLRATLEIAERIQRYAAAHPGDEVVLHADMTGGLRHTNMLLLDAIRLLQYQGITIGGIFYSNYQPPTTGAAGERMSHVEELADIYDMLDLIAGAKEFMQFGSVKGLRAYFARQDCSEALREVLAAMNGFDDAMRLCHRSRFERATERLHDALQTFRDVAVDGAIPSSLSHRALLNDRLMLQMMPRIEQDYRALLRDHDALQSMQWCLSHGDLQQVITLYTETVPAYLIGKGVLSLTDELQAELETFQEHVGKGKFDPTFYFFNHYFADHAQREGSAERRKQPRTLEQYQTEYDQFLRETVLPSIDRESWTAAEVTRALDAWLREHPAIFLSGREEALSDLTLLAQKRQDGAVSLKESPRLADAIEKMQIVYEEQGSRKKLAAWQQATDGRQASLLLRFLEKAEIKRPSRKKVKKAPRPGVLAAFFGRLELNRALPLLALIESGLLRKKPTVSAEQLMALMRDYFTIKDERNIENHAKEAQGIFADARSLQTYLGHAINRVQEAVNA